MAKRKQGRKKRAAAKPIPEAKAAPAKAAPENPAPAKAAPAKPKPKPAAAAPEPAFWFGFEVAWAKIAVARVVIFSLFAIDALMQIRHAPRYGASGFNVGQISLFDSLGPTRGSFLVCELVNAYLLILAACGIATRVVLPLATAIYAWLYFGSQLDSYQHHYLVALTLLLSCFIPWQRPRDATPSTPVRAWALRLLLIQLAIMYLWAAISKMSAAWLDGHALSLQLGGTLRHMIDSTIGIRGVAVMVLATELALAATIWIPRAWPIAAPLGLLFHAGILLSTLEIGLFAWLMIGIYVLVVPDRIWIAIGERIPTFDRARLDKPRWIIWLICIAGGVALAAISRFEHSLLVGCVLVVVPVAAAVLYRDRRVATFAIAHLLAFATWTAVDRVSSVASDYYLLWGGHARRTGDRETAEMLYRKTLSIDPDEATAHFQLARLLLARGADQDAIGELHATEELHPHDAGAFVIEGKWLQAHGRRDEALAKAKQAVAAEPNDKEARSFLQTFTP